MEQRRKLRQMIDKGSIRGAVASKFERFIDCYGRCNMGWKRIAFDYEDTITRDEAKNIYNEILSILSHKRDDNHYEEDKKTAYFKPEYHPHKKVTTYVWFGDE